MRGNSSGQLTILLIENDPLVRNWLAELLVRENYRIFEADNAAEARTVSASIEGAIHLIIASADEDDGVVAEIQGSRPSVKVLQLSTRSREAAKSDNSFLPEAGFLQKPLSPVAVVETVSSLLMPAREQTFRSAAHPGFLPN